MTVILVLLYLTLATVAGFGLTFVSRMPWDLEGRVAVGTVLGFSTAAMLTWLIAIPIGMSALPVMLGALALTAVVAACVRWTPWQAQLSREVKSFVDRWRHLHELPLLLLVVPAALFFLPFYSHALAMHPDGLYAGHINIYGDWTTHLGLATYLSTAQQLLPPNNPMFSGINVTYSFLPDFFSSIMIILGVSPEGSLSFMSALVSMALVVIFYSTAKRLTGSAWAALMAALLLFVSCGLGAVLIPGDIIPTDSGPFGWIGGLVNLVSIPPHDYTFLPDLGYWWRNALVAYLIPQRTALFGWSLGLLAIAWLWHGWRQNSTRELLLAGILLGAMPLIHFSSYVDLMVFAGGLALVSLRRWRQWAAFFLPALALGLPQALMILPPPALRHPFLGIQLGWMASTTGRQDNILWFWLINTGLLIPLAILTFFFRRQGRPNLSRFLLPAWLLFVIPNIFLLSPWDFDNSKWLVWWAIPASMLAGLALVVIARRGKLMRTLVVVAVLISITPGLLDLNRAWQEQLNPGLRFLDNDELAMAAWAQSDTSQDAVFLTGWQNNMPIVTLSHRAEVMGFPTWLWSWDIDYRPRQQDVIAMLQGARSTDTLLIQYGVSYVVIGPHELQDAHANLAFYQQYYPLAYRSPAGEYQVFKVS